MSHSSSDGFSEVSSLFSHPTTRCSSITTHYNDSLLTPCEKAAPVKHEITGPRRMIRHSLRAQPNTELSSVPETAEVDPEPHGPYFSIPINGTSDSDIQHHKSTKDLISRFESLERTSSPASTPKNIPRTEGPKYFSPSPGSISKRDSNQKPEGRSPLRRSFGNLLAIFSKKTKAPSKDKSALTSVPYRLDAPRFVPKPKIVPERVEALHIGPLVYLSPSSSDAAGSLPVWTDCTATLFPTHILVTWYTSQGNPHSHPIPLIPCIDVHSLALEELGPAEIALLPARELKVFELLFKDKHGEKFVAASVHERAGWISAIWDVILQSREEEKAGSIMPSEASDNSIRYLSPVDNTKVSFISASAYYAERDLPPTPVPSSPSYNPNICSPRPSRPEAFLDPSRTGTSSPRSASILDLNKRSMVRQRLSQIEPSRSTSPRKGRETGLGRQSSVRSTDEDSLLDLYKNDLLPPPTTSRSSWPATSKLAQIPETASEHGPSRGNSPTSMYPTSVYPTSAYPASNPDARLGPLVELLQDQATKHYYHTNDLGDQISSLHSDIREMFQELKVAVGDQPVGEVERFVDCVNKSMLGLENRLSNVNGSADAMAGVKDKLNSIHEEIQTYKLGNRGDINREVLEKLDELKSGMQDREAIPRTVVLELEKLRSAVATQTEPREMVLSNLKPSSKEETSFETHGDLAELNRKLDTLLETWKVLPKEVPEPQVEAPELSEFAAILRDDQAQRSSQVTQQTDSVRYLNELNTWLETFVNENSSRMDIVASGVEQLRRELVPSQDAREGSESLLANIQLLLAESKERDQSLAVLHASVNGLFSAVHDRLVGGGDNLTTEAVVGLLQNQKQDQERMFKTLATDLSHDIKGERLRFVEAMKEATAINVQIHVEEFKKQLTKEVLTMTQEVGRLQKERQALEQQIADLFTFYAKQKNLTAGMMGLAPPGGMN